MVDESAILLGKAEKPVSLLLRYANRHGLIAGATGTGKTVTLKVLAEGFSRRGVPVFLADVKGDLAGFCHPGEQNPKLAERLKRLKLTDFSGSAFPVVFWDVFGQQGHPIRTTVSEMGPLLLARLMELPEAQEGILNIVFRIADDQGLLLLDFKDLRALLAFASENAAEIGRQYGNVTRASVGSIQRRLLVLEQQGADKFFGEPALAIDDLLRLDADGRGPIHVLAADKLFGSPRIYATLLLWLLAELFETMPEVGDEEAPRLVFFFDEAHLLFENAPRALIEQVEQVVRLIRSKGIGIYFVTQSPLDIPDDVLAQLGNRVQHALRASTPREQKAVRAIAETMAANPKLDTADAITKLAVGEALVSTLDDAGRPTMVARTLIAPPVSRFGPITPAERSAVLAASPMKGRYDRTVDRESAYERLNGRAAQSAPPETPAGSGGASRQPWDLPPISTTSWGGFGGGRSRREGLGEAMAKSVVRSVGSAIGREIARGVLGALFRSR